MLKAGILEPLPGEPVAVNEQGRPVVVRHQDEKTGKIRTIVENEDGSTKIFGEATVASLTRTSEAAAHDFLDNLTDLQLRGCIHELGQRLVEVSSLYRQRVAELEKLRLRLDFAFFALSPRATRRQLDVAYRKMAKIMHPDKNGGTEEANLRFQLMKERYERLSKHLDEERHASATFVSRLLTRALAPESAATERYVGSLVARCASRAASRQSGGGSQREALCQQPSALDFKLKRGDTTKAPGEDDLDTSQQRSRAHYDAMARRVLSEYRRLQRGLRSVDESVAKATRHLDELHSS